MEGISTSMKSMAPLATSIIPAWLRARPEFGYDNLRAELDSLSAEELIRAEHDVKGTAGRIIETPEAIDKMLERLEDEIGNVPEKEAYEMALFANPDYVESNEFRVMFLRAEQFEVEAAARRMVQYWDRKVHLFGTEKAFRRLNFLLDFEENDEKALAGGGLRLLPIRDEAGRAIIFTYRKYYDNHPDNKDSMVRLFWHIVHAALEDPEDGVVVQQNGIVGLGGVGLSLDAIASIGLVNFRNLNRSLHSDIFEALPLRFCGFHNSIPNRLVKKFIEHTLRSDSGHAHYLARFRLHFGTSEEFLVKLGDCGIRPHMVPTELGGSLDFNYPEWIDRKRKMINCDPLSH